MNFKSRRALPCDFFVLKKYVENCCCELSHTENFYGLVFLGGEPFLFYIWPRLGKFWLGTIGAIMYKYLTAEPKKVKKKKSFKKTPFGIFMENYIMVLFAVIVLVHLF